jgi:glucosamine--fructose-6-phosphate aminotransferase (isomerizing)
MTNPLWEEIQLQADNLTQVLEHLYGPERPALERAADFIRNDRPILFTGVASAAYLCMPSEFYLGSRGRVASTIYAADAIYSLLPALRNANLVINTRSGETAEIAKLCQLLKAQGIPFTTITNEPGSTAAQMADRVVWVNTHKDTLVSINVVTGMMAATLLLSAAVMGELDVLRLQLDQVVIAMQEAIDQAAEQAGAMAAFFAGLRPIHLLYRGATRGAAYCGRLALEEVARFPSVPLEAAEFRQGPNEVVDEHFGAVLFNPAGEQGLLNTTLARDLLRSGGRVMAVGNTDSLADHPALLKFPCGNLPDFLRPLVEVIPMQVLAYKLAEAQGYTPGEVRYITKVITSETGIPNQG